MDTFFTERQKTIDCKITDKLNFWFFGDVHRDTASCDVDRWRWFHAQAKHDPEDKTWFFGMGDYNDFASTREKKALKAGGIHETTMAAFDLMAEKNNRRFARECNYMRGRVLGLVDGNHSWVFENGKTDTEDLSERLLSDAIGWLCHYTIKFNFEHSGKTQMVHFVLCHGKAGGKTSGNTVNQVDDLRRVFPAADVYVMGHDHQRYAKPESVLIYYNSGLKQKRQFLCRSGSFKKGYSPETKSYEVGRLLRPSDLGALKLIIGFHRDTRDGQDRIITDISAII